MHKSMSSRFVVFLSTIGIIFLSSCQEKPVSTPSPPTVTETVKPSPEEITTPVPTPTPSPEQKSPEDDWTSIHYEVEASRSIPGLPDVLAPQIALEDYPRVDGYTATLPLSLAIYRLTTGSSQKEAEREIRHTKTTNAYYSLLSSQTLMKKLVMKNIRFMKPPVTWIADEMGDLINSVASYTNEENALGYSVYYYAKNMNQQPELRFMAVDGVTPGNKTIRSGEYPYVNEFYVAIRKDSPKDSGEYRLFQWLTGDNGQALIEGLGYVGIRETAAPTLAAGEKPVEDGAVLHLGENQRIVLDGMLIRGIPETRSA